MQLLGVQARMSESHSMSSTFNVWCTPCRWLTVIAACTEIGHDMVHSHSGSVYLVDCGSAAERACIAGPCEGTVDDSASSGLRQLGVNSQSMTLADDLFAMHSALVTLTCKLTYSLLANCKLIRCMLGGK